ncbi:MAG: DUF1592 domain-containing protein [Akkermansiaceae bacterium]
MKPPVFKIILAFLALTLSVSATEHPVLNELKKLGTQSSKYLKQQVTPHSTQTKPDLKGFQTQIAPILKESCYPCHGPDKQKGDLRLDELNPDLINGHDADYWLEVIEVLSNNEMPPEEKDVDISPQNRGKLIDWLSGQVLIASQVKRSQGGHTSFRRMTRYEYSYALQDLLHLPHDFSQNLPPETPSEDGFRNSSERLQMTSQQFSIYRDIARQALQAATIIGDAPTPTYFSMTMEKGGEQLINWAKERSDYFQERKKVLILDNAIDGNFKSLYQDAREQKNGDKFRSTRTHFYNKKTGKGWSYKIPYGFSPWSPVTELPTTPPDLQPHILIIPADNAHKIWLGNTLPDRGSIRIRFRAHQAIANNPDNPSVSLQFGHKPNNNSDSEYQVNAKQIAITAPPEKPEFYEWTIPLDALERNPYLRTASPEARPNPAEYFQITNSYQGENEENANVIIDYIEVIAPYKQQWPPASHLTIFPTQNKTLSETHQARTILTHFMPKAWRRPVTDDEITRKLKLFQTIRPAYNDFQETILEVIASILSSPHFIYISQSAHSPSDYELASRLSYFLWSSQPNQELLNLAKSGKIRDPHTLAAQAERMLADPRAHRFTKHFTDQWLNLDLLKQLEINKKTYPQFSPSTLKSMQQEPVAMFQDMLTHDHSIIDFIHSDHAYLDATLAHHYGISGIYGNHFRKVKLPPELKSTRGGLLTQPGLLAMNSDGNDSHPLKRGIWLLENILHDPPPPPPPAVPEIDLTDPNILKMTLKERMEDHRNDPACSSCHIKIDPWGIVFEEYDAVGLFRNNINGKPVDAQSYLVDKTKIVGINGLKSYLLENRQDQFARAMVHKLACYALGRPLNFSDHAQIEKITAQTRKNGDGLKTLILNIIKSDLFRNS